MVADNGVDAKNAVGGGVATCLIAMRLRAGYESGTLAPSRVSLLTTGSANYYWRLVLNPTFVVPPAAYVTIANSIAEADTATVATVTPGTGYTLSSGYVANDSSALDETINSAVTIAAKIDGTRDVLALVVRPTSGTPPFLGSLRCMQLL